MARRSLATVAACVGDDPSATSTPASDGGTPDSPTGEDGAQPGTDASADGSTDAGTDATIDGPRCDPQKGFTEVDRLAGISTEDDELAVWVSADELTAYVSAMPTQGSVRKLRRSTRANRNADFSAPTEPPELATLNAGPHSPYTLSMTANGLVLVFTSGLNEDVYVSLRASNTGVFPAATHARSRANEGTMNGDSFITAGGEAIMLGRETGSAAGHDIIEAPRDINSIYGPAAEFVDYSVASEEANVSSDSAEDRRPVMSSDRLMIAFASNRTPASGTNVDLYIANRAGPSGVFTDPVRLPDPVSSSSADLPGTISEDKCVIYFTSDRPGGFGLHDVYVARRAK